MATQHHDDFVDAVDADIFDQDGVPGAPLMSNLTTPDLSPVQAGMFQDMRFIETVTQQLQQQYQSSLRRAAVATNSEPTSLPHTRPDNFGETASTPTTREHDKGSECHVSRDNRPARRNRRPIPARGTPAEDGTRHTRARHIRRRSPLSLTSLTELNAAVNRLQVACDSRAVQQIIAQEHARREVIRSEAIHEELEIRAAEARRLRDIARRALELLKGRV